MEAKKLSSENETSNGILAAVSNSAIERDNFAIEAMKVFMSHQGTRVATPFNKIKIWFGINGWKQEFNYNFNDIAKKSYEMADAMCKAKSEHCC